MPHDRPLISLGLVSHSPPPSYAAAHDDEDEERDEPPRQWYHYLPLLVVFALLLIPQPSLLIVLVNYHIRVLHAPHRFLLHLTVTYTLTFLAFSSLIAVVVRDPGSVPPARSRDEAMDEREDMNVMQALLATNDYAVETPGKWCRKCRAPKPERAHHCSQCRRCVLKMDHHCAWLGHRCLGHNTYPSFLHFLFCVTVLSLYVSVMCITAVYFAFTNPLSIDENTPLHEMFLAFYGVVMAMVIGPFLVYHLYLTSTNQTTLEHITPYLILRQLPELPEAPPEGRQLSNPPLEHELSHRQRRLIREAHGYIRMYDVGWWRNWAQVMGWDRPLGWIYRIAYGGGGKGDGKTFPRNPRADDLLRRLAEDLVDADRIL